MKKKCVLFFFMMLFMSVTSYAQYDLDSVAPSPDRSWIDEETGMRIMSMFQTKKFSSSIPMESGEIDVNGQIKFLEDTEDGDEMYIMFKIPDLGINKICHVMKSFDETSNGKPYIWYVCIGEVKGEAASVSIVMPYVEDEGLKCPTKFTISLHSPDTKKEIMKFDMYHIY